MERDPQGIMGGLSHLVLLVREIPSLNLALKTDTIFRRASVKH